MSNEIVKYNLSGEYLFKGQKGEQKGEIYLSPDKNFIGSIRDTGNGYEKVHYLLYGNLTPEKLRFLKTPKDPYFSNVFWSLNHKNSDDCSLQYEGYFFLMSSSPSQKMEITDSLEKSIQCFKKNELIGVDSITKKLFGNMHDLELNVKKNLQIFRKSGFGEIILNNP